MTVAGMPDDFEQIVVRFVGATGRCPAAFALSDDHREWRRRDDETPAAFERRVVDAEPAARVIVFFPCIPTEDDMEADHDNRQQDHRRTLRIASGA